MTEDGGSGRSSLSVIGNEEFDFDDIIINSTAYQRAFMSYQARQISDTKSKGKGTDVADPTSSVDEGNPAVTMVGENEELDVAEEKIRELQQEILSTKLGQIS